MPDVIATLLDRHGQSFAEELGIPVERNEPSPLFRLLTAALLLSANLDARLGLRTAKALHQAKLSTAERMASASDRERWDVLDQAKYLRKDKTAAHLGEVARHALDAYDGDLRTMRGDGVRDALLEFKGIGEVGADIFLREVQVAWPELYPFADERVTGPAERLGLPKTARGLAGRVDGEAAFVRLTAALVRCDINDDYEAVRG